MLSYSRVLFCSAFCDTYPVEHSVTNHTYQVMMVIIIMMLSLNLLMLSAVLPSSLLVCLTALELGLICANLSKFLS